MLKLSIRLIYLILIIIISCSMYVSAQSIGLSSTIKSGDISYIFAEKVVMYDLNDKSWENKIEKNIYIQEPVVYHNCVNYRNNRAQDMFMTGNVILEDSASGYKEKCKMYIDLYDNDIKGYFRGENSYKIRKFDLSAQKFVSFCIDHCVYDYTTIE